MRHVPNLHTVVVAALLASLAGTAPSGRAATIDGSVALREIGLPPVVSGGDSAGGRTINGDPISAHAAFGGGAADVDIAPRLGQAVFGGHSAAESFSDFVNLQRETSLQGFIDINDHFSLSGNVQGPAVAFLVLHASGTLLPALDFEHEFTNQRGDATVTANAHISYFLNQRLAGGTSISTGSDQIGQVGSWLGSGNPCFPAVCRIGTGVDVTFSIPLLIAGGARQFDIEFSVAANGFKGGGFDFGGVPVAAGARGLDADATSTLSFELQLPPGLSFTADGGYFMHATTITPVPEPPAAWLLAAGALAAGYRLRRRAKG